MGRKILIILVSVLWLNVGCGNSAKDCCRCLISNDCWATDVCPLDPIGSCYWWLDDGKLPSYADGDSGKVCLGYGVDCKTQFCSESCDGVIDP